MNRFSLEGRVAIVTGSGRGIGREIAMGLARCGAAVVINGRNEARLAETCEAIEKAGGRALAVCCDVSVPEEAALLVEKAAGHFGRIDILVNNVGLSMRGKVADLNPDVFRTICASNVLAAVNPTVPAIKYLRETKGSLVFISSLAGIRGLPGLSAYCAAKMSLRAIAESVRIEEHGSGIHVGLVYVGYTENEPGKETLGADGAMKKLKPRSGRGVQTMRSVAEAVIKNIRKRRFISVLTPVGKLNYFMQARFPMLVERIIISNRARFDEQMD